MKVVCQLLGYRVSCKVVVNADLDRNINIMMAKNRHEHQHRVLFDRRNVEKPPYHSYPIESISHFSSVCVEHHSDGE